MHLRQTHRSQATFLNRSSYFRIWKPSLPFGAVSNCILQLAQLQHTRSNSLEVATTLRHHAGNRLVVTGYDHFLTAGDAVQEFSKAGLGLQCSNDAHILTTY